MPSNPHGTIPIHPYLIDPKLGANIIQLIIDRSPLAKSRVVSGPSVPAGG